MKVAPAASPLPTRHVRILLSHTCLQYSIIISTQLPKTGIYKRATHLTWRSRTIAHSHSHIRSQTKMAEKEVTGEAQRKLRSKFLQVLRSRRQDEGIAIKFHSLAFTISLCIAQRFV